MKLSKAQLALLGVFAKRGEWAVMPMGGHKRSTFQALTDRGLIERRAVDNWDHRITQAGREEWRRQHG